MSGQSLSRQMPALAGRGLQLLDSLRNHSRLVIVSFVLVFLAGLPLVFIKGVPKYSATATIQVAPRYMKNLRDDNELDFQSNSQYRQFVEQQTKTINRYDILEKALHSLEDAGNRPWRLAGESERRAIERLQKDLRIMPVPDTYLVQITLEGEQSQGLAEVVNAVVAAFLAKSREEQVYGADERVRQLQLRESELLARHDALTRQRSDIARELGLTAFKEEDGNPFDKLRQKLREDIAEARARRFDAEARQAAFLKTGETDLITRSIQESVLIDPGLNSLKSSLNKRRADLVTAMSGLAAEHPGYQAARQEIQEIDAELRRHTEQLTSQMREGMSKRFATAVDQARRLESELQASLQETAKQSESYAARFNEAVALSNDMKQLRGELDKVRERLNFFASESNSMGLVRPVTPALVPEQAMGTGKKKLLVLLLIAAGMLALALPVGLDLLDPRVRTVNDAEKQLGFAPLGWLIERGEVEREGFAEDQLRRLASALIREQDRHGTRAIAFSGLKPGAGTTRLVRDLTRTLNRLGIPALAIEANAFKPDAAYGSGPGLAALLADPQSCPAVNEANGIPCLNVGTPDDQRLLDGLDRLQTVIDRLSQDYRFILVDTPPLLTASDSELVVRATGAVVVVVEAEAMTRGEVARAARQLQKLDPPSVGAIVNRVAPFVGGGYINNLVAEHAQGRKLAADSFSPALKATLQALLWDAAALGLRGLHRLHQAARFIRHLKVRQS